MVTSKLIAVVVAVVALAGCGGDDISKTLSDAGDGVSVKTVHLPDGTVSYCVITDVWGDGSSAIDCKHSDETRQP